MHPARTYPPDALARAMCKPRSTRLADLLTGFVSGAVIVGIVATAFFVSRPLSVSTERDDQPAIIEQDELPLPTPTPDPAALA